MSVIVWVAGLSFASPVSPPLKKRLTFAALLVALGGVLLMYKLFSAGPEWEIYNPQNMAFVFGFSYITFRLIHFLIECFRGGVPACSLTDFTSYVFFFPTFLAGPIERFPVLHAQTSGIKTAEIGDINYGLYRIFIGIFKKVAIADTLRRVVAGILANPEGSPRLLVMLALYGSAVQLYMDFSGYCDIAIGSARLFGYRIMENFNSPFFKDNLAAFWRNWHISLYNWIRDYFFFPVFGWRPSRIKNYIGIFSSMMIFSVWHRLSLNFLLLGIYNGLGLTGWYFFQGLKRRFAFLRRLSGFPLLRTFGCVFTFTFFSFGVVFFRDNFQQAWGILRRFFHS